MSHSEVPGAWSCIESGMEGCLNKGGALFDCAVRWLGLILEIALLSTFEGGNAGRMYIVLSI